MSNKTISQKIKLLSANCQGLRNREKQIDVLSYLKDTNASIVCLQDTHLLESDQASIKKIWHECYINGSRRNSRGVSILLNNNFEYKVSSMYKDNEGNVLQLIITCGSLKINLINIYAPNKDDPRFFSKVAQLSQMRTQTTSYFVGTLIWCLIHQKIVKTTLMSTTHRLEEKSLK